MATFVSDTFTEASDTALTSHTGETGATWTKNTNAVYNTHTVQQVVAATDRVRLNDSGTNEIACYASGLPAGIDYDVQVTVQVVSRDGYHGISGRGATSTQDFYQAFVDSAGAGGEGYNISKYVSGTYTNLAEYVTTPANGDTMMLRMRGSSVLLIINGTERGSATDTSFATAGRVGMYGAQYAAPGNSVGYHFDDFSASDAPVTWCASGTVGAGGTTSVTVAYPSGIAANDLLLMVVANRPNAQTPDDISGWTKLSATGGAGSEAAGTGTVRGTIYYKIADGSESGSVTVNCTSGTSMFGRMFRFRSNTGTFDVATATGSDNSAGTGVSATAGSDPGVTADDLVVAAFICSEDTARAASESLTSTGVTYYSGVELQDSGITTGNDLGMVVWQQTAKSGTSSAAPVFAATMSGTNSARSAGPVIFVRLRASTPPAGGAFTPIYSFMLAGGGSM